MYNWAKNVFFKTFGPVVAAILLKISKSWSCCELDKGTDVCEWFG